MSSTATSPGRTAKIPTHLSLNADVILGSSTTMNNVHTIESLLIDVTNQIRRFDLIVWARSALQSGTYILSNSPLITSRARGTYALAPDNHSLRRIPEEFDGTDPDKPSLPSVAPSAHFVAVVKHLEDNGKRATLVGKQYMGKRDSWVDFEFTGIFESLPRWQNWFFPPVGSLISGDGLINRFDADDMMEVFMRRCSLICEAPAPMQQALGLTATSSNDKVDALRKAHLMLQKHKQQQQQQLEGVEDVETGTTSDSSDSILLEKAIGVTPASASTSTPSKQKAREPIPATLSPLAPANQEMATHAAGLQTRTKRARGE